MLERALLAWLFVVATSASASPEAAPPASAAPPATRVRVLVLEPTGSTVEPALRTAIGGLVASELGRYDVLDVLAADDVRKAVELEADRQAAGCTTDSCLAEVAGALGARLVVFGDAAQLGTVAVLNLNLYDSERAVSAGRVTISAPSLGDLPARLPQGVAELVARTLEEIAPGSSSARAAARGPAVLTERSATIVLDVLLVGATLAGMVVGGVGMYVAAGLATGFSFQNFNPLVAVATAPIALGGVAGGAALGALLFQPAEPGWVALAASATALVGLAGAGTGVAVLAAYRGWFNEERLGLGLLYAGGVVAVVGPPVAAVWTANALAE